MIAALLSAGLLASYWNVPIFAHAAAGDALSNKTVYNTLIRLGATQTEMGKAVAEFLVYHNWRTAVLIWNSSILTSSYVKDGVHGAFARSQITLNEIDITTITYEAALAQIRLSARSKMR